MLELKKVTKIYETDNFKQVALDEVSLNFRKCEFAAILGPSGSGKTTLLNIIGGLDHYTNGDLIINDISTKNYKDSAWDSYRNHRVGFVFQSYNLISHQTILRNVELALTLSGVSREERRKRAIQALKDVGLEQHINKRPNQLSGGQMQRVAIARALVNDPEIILADEPTGALDSETSVQIMELLKSISSKKLVIMVTHNPELANIYANRIINIKDGKILSDSNPYNGKTKSKDKDESNKSKKTSMSFLTALSLSFNNLMTKKGRTILVSVAGSIGIIGIALIMAVSTGTQKYIDSIQEDALSSYPLTITHESADITSLLLSMTSGGDDNDNSGKVMEQQYITSMLSNIKANDLKSFKSYLDKNKSIVNENVTSIKYSYSIDPLIYTVDVTGKLAKLNPSNLFSSFYNTSMLGSYSSFASIFSQMIDDVSILDEQYEVLAGRWPKEYNEMIIVLSEANSISDFLVYSLGLRDTDELTTMISSIMSNEEVSINNSPKEFTYEDLMNVKLKLINNVDTYKYNDTYDVYEDMSEDDTYMKKVYDNATELKIVGVVTAKSGSTTSALSPGVAYRSDLIKHIIDNASNNQLVKKQLADSDVDVFTNKRFDSKTNNFDYGFDELVSVDASLLQSAFNINIDEAKLQSQTQDYMTDISNSITTDVEPAKKLFIETFDKMIDGLFKSIDDKISLNDISLVIDNYLNTKEATSMLAKLNSTYVIPADTFKTTYSGLLQVLLKIYISSYYSVDQSLTTDPTNLVAIINDDIKASTIEMFKSNAAYVGTVDVMARAMTEALVKKEVLTKVGELTGNITSTFASSFNVDQSKIARAFTFKFTEEELTRVVSAMMNKTEKNANSNLISLGYQDIEDPTSISFYFGSFDNKENFLSIIDDYNRDMKDKNDEDKVINYTDTTGILMSSVKTIVNAVSYILIAFVSIALVVSSIMIGIITYISVFERTKEIGILRSIGASKHNISSIFNAETFIIGLLSGLFGIGVSYSFIPIINTVVYALTKNSMLKASLNPSSAILLIVLSIILTLIGGLIPAKKASRKDPVEALRSE